ncbi:hypothetical protein [Clostridium sp.]
MKLNTLEIEILIDIYDADMLPGMAFEMENYKLKEKELKDKKHEFAFYLENLKKYSYIKYDEKEAFLKCEIVNNKYNNNITMIFEEKIHIDYKGIKLVESFNLKTQSEMYRCG